jgi:[protein-PII] uridylyltransferase
MRGGYATALAGLETPEAVAAFLLARREEMRIGAITPRASFRPPDGLPLSRQLTELTDAVVQQLFRLALPPGEERERVRGLIAVAATGSYGRRELSPHSDVDVTFVVAEEEDETLDRTVRRMFLSLMEVFSQRAQLKVGYAYRTLADLPQLDHQTQTALLDARLVTGSHPLFHQFTQELPRHIWPAAFVRQKVAERSEQAARHGETIYRVEPQLRDGPGGLRELQVAEWVAAVAFPAARGDVWPQLARAGWLSPQDAAAACAARGFFLHVRNIAHFEAGRAADLLTRERQEAVAALMGFQDDGCVTAVERFMESYYRHAENARRVAGFVTARCLRERLSLDEEIAVDGGELVPSYPGLNVTEPHFLLRLCRAYQEHGLEPGPDLRRMIAEQLAETEALAVDAETGQQFLALLDGTHLAAGSASRLPPPAPGEPGVILRPTLTSTLGLMGALGILQRLIPELGAAYRRVPFDPVHRHTIGHHSLRVVQALERLREGLAEEPPGRGQGGYFSTSPREGSGEFRRIWDDVENPEVLYLAGLLHDIGKLDPTPGHEETGAAAARRIAARLGMDAAGAEKVAALVRHHLLMSRTSQLRDLTLDATIRDFVAAVPTLDLLNMLFLLTHADMEATGVLSPVKVRFLEDLYYRAERALSEQAPITMDDERLHRYRRRLSRQLSERVQEHCEGMPVSYLLNTRPEQIAAHIRAVEALQNSGPVVEWGGEPGSPITTLTVCTYDDPEPGLLSRLAGVLYAHEISVHSAQVFTRERTGTRAKAEDDGAAETETSEQSLAADERAIAIDTLWVDFHARQVPPFKKMEVETDLVRVLRGQPVVELIAARHKQLPAAIAPTRVAFDNNLAEGHTVVDVEVPDQPGTLYRITRTLAALGWVIHSARISTQGDRARDAFYITDPSHAKIEGDEAALAAAFTREFMGG